MDRQDTVRAESDVPEPQGRTLRGVLQQAGQSELQVFLPERRERRGNDAPRAEGVRLIEGGQGLVMTSFGS